MTTTITGRISSAPAADNTKRVATVGAGANTPASYGADSWGGSWGGSWGRTWFGFNVAVSGTAASPAVDVTSRIGETPAADNTPRVSLAALSADNTPRIGSSPTANNTKRVTLA